MANRSRSEAPSPRFTGWLAQFEAWKESHAPSGLHFQVTAAYGEQLYVAHGGIEEATTLGDLGRVARTVDGVQASQRVVWDAHAREVAAAVDEGGEDAVAEALRESREWIRRLLREGQAVDESSKAAGWVRPVVAACPANPLIRAEEVWGLWRCLAGARRLGEGMQDRLLEELELAGTPRTQLAETLRWSYSRLQRRLLVLEEECRAREQLVRQGDVPGVISIGRETARSSRPHPHLT